MRWRRQRTAVLCLGALTPLAIFAGGCANGVIGCPDIKLSDAVTVEIPRALYVPSALLTLELCDGDGCASDEAVLPDEWRGWPARLPLFLDALEEPFGEGDLVATVAIEDVDAVVATQEGTVTLSVDEPHGPRCPDVLTGEVILEESDRSTS